MTNREKLAASQLILAQVAEARGKICAFIDQENSAEVAAGAAAKRLEHAQERNLVDAALALEHSVDNAEIDDEIATLRRKESAHRRAQEQLKPKLRNAEIECERATLQVRDATQALAMEEGLEPARVRLAEAGDAFFAELVTVAAWHRAVYWIHGDRSKNVAQISGVYGPAMDFLRKLPSIEWMGFPYSIKPEFLKSLNGAGHGASGLAEASALVEASISNMVSP